MFYGYSPYVSGYKSGSTLHLVFICFLEASLDWDSFSNFVFNGLDYIENTGQVYSWGSKLCSFFLINFIFCCIIFYFTIYVVFAIHQQKDGMGGRWEGFRSGTYMHTVSGFMLMFYLFEVDNLMNYLEYAQEICLFSLLSTVS